MVNLATRRPTIEVATTSSSLRDCLMLTTILNRKKEDRLSRQTVIWTTMTLSLEELVKVAKRACKTTLRLETRA